MYPELLDGSFRDPPLPPKFFSCLIGRRAEEEGFKTQQKDGTAWEGQAPTEGSMDAILPELDAGPGDPGRAALAASSIPSDPQLGWCSSWMGPWEELQK